MKRIGRMLMLAGLAVCLGGAGLAVIDAYIHLPPEAVKAIAMVLPFVVGGGLLVVGAAMGRAATRDAKRGARREQEGDTGHDTRAVAAGVPDLEVPVTRAEPSHSRPL